MTISDTLKTAYRWHRQNACGRVYPRAPGPNPAQEAIAAAREDVAAGRARYPSTGKPAPAVIWQEPDSKIPQIEKIRKTGLAYVDNPAATGLRFVGRVVPEFSGAPWDSRGNTGWYTDPYGDTFKDGSGLCWGVVYQLPGRKGAARFVAGYQIGGVDGGPTLDFGVIFTTDPGDSYWVEFGDHGEIPALRKAARHADSLAQNAAESERDYQTAWQAGRQWADKGETIEGARAEALAILKERRAVKGGGSYPALCNAIRARVSELLETIAAARRKRATLAEGDESPLIFWSGDAALRAAFCEGAGLSEFPKS